MKRTCSECGQEFDTRQRGPRALTCSAACQHARRNAGARERMADLEFRARRNAAQRERWRDPEVRAEQNRRRRECRRERRRDPEVRAEINRRAVAAARGNSRKRAADETFLELSIAAVAVFEMTQNQEVRYAS